MARDQSISGEIDQDDAWAVIRAYFKQHGLVSQQISSFNRFLSFSVQEIVKEHRENRIKVEPQYVPGGKSEENIYYDITFDQVHVNNCPRM